jgi:plastocyanin
MKRLAYLTPLLVMLVLVFASLAMAQSYPNQYTPNQTQTPNATGQTTPAQTTTPTQNTTPAPNTQKAQNPNATGQAAPAQNTKTVNIGNHAFNPAQLNVAPGTTVTWVNNDTVAHTATADNGLFDSKVIQPGGSYSVWFGGAGTVTYHCAIHPDMKGSIIVGGTSGGGATTPTNSSPQQTTTNPQQTTTNPQPATTNSQQPPQQSGTGGY